MRNPKGGRPSKGDRFTITVRLATAYQGKLERWVKDTGETRSDLAARLLMNHLDTHGSTQHSDQQSIDVEQLS